MPATNLTSAEEIVAGWRTGRTVDGWDSPAGPLFSSGAYAEEDITFTEAGCTATSGCTQSCATSWMIICC